MFLMSCVWSFFNAIPLSYVIFNVIRVVCALDEVVRECVFVWGGRVLGEIDRFDCIDPLTHSGFLLP